MKPFLSGLSKCIIILTPKCRIFQCKQIISKSNMGKFFMFIITSKQGKGQQFQQNISTDKKKIK